MAVTVVTVVPLGMATPAITTSSPVSHGAERAGEKSRRLSLTTLLRYGMLSMAAALSSGCLCWADAISWRSRFWISGYFVSAYVIQVRVPAVVSWPAEIHWTTYKLIVLVTVISRI